MPAPSLSAPAPTKPAAVFKRDLERWEELDDQRKELARQSRDLGKEQAEIEQKVEAFVRDQAGKTRTMERSGFRLSILTVAASVSWKSLFQKTAGVAAVKQAEKDAGTRDKVSIERL